MPHEPRVVRRTTAYAHSDSPSLMHVSPIHSHTFRASPSGREYDIGCGSTPMPCMLISCDEAPPGMTTMTLAHAGDNVLHTFGSNVNERSDSDSESGSSQKENSVRHSLSRSLPYSWCSAYADETPSTTRARWLHCQTFGRVVPSIAESSSTATADSSLVANKNNNNGRRKSRRTRRWGPAELVWGYVDARRAMQATPHIEAWPATTTTTAAFHETPPHAQQQQQQKGRRWRAPVRHNAARAQVNRILFSTAEDTNNNMSSDEDESGKRLNSFRDSVSTRPSTMTAAVARRMRMYNSTNHSIADNNNNNKSISTIINNNTTTTRTTTTMRDDSSNSSKGHGRTIKSLSASCQLGLPPSSTDSLVCAAPRRQVVMSHTRNRSKQEEQSSLLLLPTAAAASHAMHARKPSPHHPHNIPSSSSSSDDDTSSNSSCCVVDARKAAQARRVGEAWRAKATVRVPMSRLARGRILHPLFVDDIDDDSDICLY